MTIADEHCMSLVLDHRSRECRPVGVAGHVAFPSGRTTDASRAFGRNDATSPSEHRCHVSEAAVAIHLLHQRIHKTSTAAM